jgi:hypothetical protein
MNPFSDDVFAAGGGPARADARARDETAYRESLIRADYDRCHPGETFEDLKRRARFTKEDKGLLRQWMAVAAQRAAAAREEMQAAGLLRAAA